MNAFGLVVYLLVGVGAGAISVVAVCLARSVIGRLLYALPVAAVATSPVWTSLVRGGLSPRPIVVALLMGGVSVLIGGLLSVGLLRQFRPNPSDGSDAAAPSEGDAGETE